MLTATNKPAIIALELLPNPLETGILFSQLISSLGGFMSKYEKYLWAEAIIRLSLPVFKTS